MTDIVVTQIHSVDRGVIAQMIVDHYAALNMRLPAHAVSFRVSQGSTGGFSSSGPALIDATVRVPDALRKPGLPSSFTLEPGDVREIVAERLRRILGISISATDIRIEEHGSSGGFSGRSADVSGATLRTTVRA